ncbi:diacylglycerol pyrophosphate phosphatase [Blumeria hordei DH14]|uniref:Diacylglycerol pyrophosphate phosphatase n=1 Tax=Blumeria graminis f. sp. hordei (strain DH14) TaxID=546991 RepID=N1J583_BLUG1|nr:diacylglycerol pyrophosphate phosphatase [Blumeria hordei DH14]
MDCVPIQLSRFISKNMGGILPLIKPYIPDCIGLVLLSVAYLFLVRFIEPFHRMFFINNINLQYPHAAVERVSVSRNVLYAGLIPLLVLFAWLGIERASLHKLNVTILGFLISIALALFITDSVKNAVGRPRPDLIARCKPAPRTPENILVTIDVCTETDYSMLHDGWRSFPSGHSSFAFSGLGFLSFFLAGQLQVFRPNKNFLGTLLSIAPIMSAIMIAISRCEDYRHDWYDVISGSLIGISTAFFSYRRYYPHLQSRRCEEPFNHKNIRSIEGVRRIKNDEESARPSREFRSSDDEDVK